VSRSFELDDLDSVTVGTVGTPGRRTFFLQARSGTESMTLKVEKQQVAALAQFLSDVLSDLPAPAGPAPDAPELIEPATPEWAVGGLQLAYDGTSDRVILLAEELLPDDSADTGAEAATARLVITRHQASALVRRGFELIGAGRPPCPLCGLPIDPEGHSCPRTNGHKPPSR